MISSRHGTSGSMNSMFRKLGSVTAMCALMIEANGLLQLWSVTGRYRDFCDCGDLFGL